MGHINAINSVLTRLLNDISHQQDLIALLLTLSDDECPGEDPQISSLIDDLTNMSQQSQILVSINVI